MEIDQPQQPQSSPELKDLQEKYEALHRLLVAVLVLMVIVTGTLCLFFRRQDKFSKVDLANYQAQTTNMVAQFKKNQPMAEELVRKFQEFGRANPDFVPYLTKYGIALNTPIGKAPAATNRLPGAAPAAAPKKK